MFVTALALVGPVILIALICALVIGLAEALRVALYGRDRDGR